ncbi:MAG: type II secretion system secretin GspD [Deltaproteobacteria bacterium]|nr:type II secretion system secretin GspD [Deltaproteobacteria bacterium]
MKFVRILGIFVLSFLLSSNFISAQDEFIQNGNDSDLIAPTPLIKPPPMPGSANGLFNDDLEPLDEEDIIRPNRDAIRDDTREMPSPTQHFPEPKKVSPSTSSSPSFKTVKPIPGLKPGKNERLKMDFVNVEIEELIKYFAEKAHINFIYDPTILSGKINIVSTDDVSMEEAYAAFLSALEVRGYIIYPSRDKKHGDKVYYKIERATNARKAPVPVITGNVPNDDSYVTRIVNLKYLSVNDIRQAVRNLLSRTGGDVIEHPQTNTLILSDYAYNIRRIIRILNMIDIEGFQEQIAVIALKNAAATDVARKVSEFFPSGSIGGSVGGAPAVARGRGEGGGVIQKVVADERTNSVILLGSESGIEKVRKFIDQIDVPMEGGGGQIHVYPLQNVKAEDISQTLASLTSGGGTGANRRRNNFPNLPQLPNSPIPQAADSGPATATLLNGEVKITADNPTNSLVIQASQRDFDVLKDIIKKLDVRRRQVFIESVILEAKVGKDAKAGVQVAGPLFRSDALKGSAGEKSSGVFGFGQGDQSLEGLLANPIGLTGLALGFRSGGSVTINQKDANGNNKPVSLPLLSAILKLSAGSTNTNVLSTPHILATANEEASIIIGEEIPQVASQQATDGGKVIASYTRIPVAKELTITPQINAGDYVTLKIKQKINERTGSVVDGQVATIKREASTTAIVKDHQTVVIGGLMEDRKESTENKVPFLGDIPILGWLFKSKETKVDKVNLLLFITPHIIRDTANMNDTFFQKLKEREGFLKDLGIDEKKNVPISGLSEDQLKMFDEEYVKSIKKEKLYPLPMIPEVDRSQSTAPAETLVPQTPVEPLPMPAPLTPAPSEGPATIPQKLEKSGELPLEDSPPEESTPVLRRKTI